MGKLQGNPRAVGYWGRRPDRVTALYGVGGQIRVALEDKLLTSKRYAGLWLVANAGDTGNGTASVPCTCTKETSATAEEACQTCYSSKWAPGYRRFLHETIHASSSAYAADATGWTLTNVELDRRLKPNRLVLSAGSLTGTIVTPALAYANPATFQDWSTNVVSYRRVAGQTVATEFSTDNGTTWVALSLINGVSRPTGTGAVRFRVTLTRASVSDESPAFEIVRVRHAQPNLRSSRFLRARPDAPDLGAVPVGSILLLNTWVIEQVMRAAVQGRLAEHQNERTWTAPLDFFTSAIAFGSVAAKLADTGEGAHHFLRPGNGMDTDETYAIIGISYSQELENMFTYQAWSERRVQPGEAAYSAW